MKHTAILFVLFILLLTLSACGGAAHDAPCTALASDASTPDAGEDASDASVVDAAPVPCNSHDFTLSVQSVFPDHVILNSSGCSGNVTFKGCGFIGVRDVQVNVQSVPFTVVDDTTIVAALCSFSRADYPTLSAAASPNVTVVVQADIIKRQPDQVQIALTFE